MGLLTVRRVPSQFCGHLTGTHSLGLLTDPLAHRYSQAHSRCFPCKEEGFIRGDRRRQSWESLGLGEAGLPAVKGEAEAVTVERGNVTSQGRGPGGTKVMFWVRPEAGTPPGLVPEGPQGALQADAESRRAGDGGSAWVYSGEGQVLPGAAWLRMGATLLWDTSDKWRSFCICTEVDLRAQLIFP